MQMRCRPLFCVVAVLLVTLAMSAQQAAPQQSPNPTLTDQQVNARVDALLRQMTLEEKIGQLNQIGAASWVPDPVKPEEHVRKGEAGSVLWTLDPALINRLQHVAMEQARVHIPLLFGYDVIHGFHTLFPLPIAMAASWDPAMVEQAQTIAAREASAIGINWTFGPMVDIARDGRWGRIVEGAGEDPYLGEAMARAQVRGFQGPQLGTPGHVVGSVKHFAGYGGADGGRDYDSSYIPEELLRNVYLRPFHAAVEAGVGTVMSAYMDLNDVPASGNRFLLQDVLRNDWGFRGFVISDAFAVASLETHGYARDPQDAAFKGLSAGVNMDMASLTYLKQLPALVQSGKISQTLIDDRVRPVLEIKVRMGLFEHPYADASQAQQVFNAPETRQFARTAAQRTMVLLRNENHTLPLKKNVASVAVVGPLADSAEDIQGSWTIEGAAKAVSALEGIRNKLRGARVEHAKGASIWRQIPSMFPQGNQVLKPPSDEEMRRGLEAAVAAARNADVTIAVLGEQGYMSGEAASRATLTLPGNQEQLLEALVATGKPVVLVVLSGRPLDTSWAAEHVPAILQAWYPATEGGNALADVLFGDANPGGKLPISWPRAVGQEPLYYNHNLTHEPETRPNFKSRYWDMLSSPLYPFGYGLSYTTFSISNLRLSQPTVRVGGTIEVTADVRNTGNVAGDDVVQLYIHQQAGSASRPVRQLEGFQRVTLAPGETKTVRFTLGQNELSFWSPQKEQWVEETEQFDVWVGEDSRATLHGTFKVTESQ